MTQPSWKRLLPLLILLVAGTSLGKDRLNVLFLIADDLRNDLGCYGSSIAITPNIDSLAASGLRFDRAYCQKAVCWPSRNSMLSGLLPENLGKANSKLTFRASHPDILSLPQLFKDHGYETASFGKILHNGQDDPASWSRPHFDPPPFNYGRKENREKHPIINQAVPENNQNPLYEAADVPDEAYEDGMTTQAAIQVLEELAESEKPFFLMVGFHKPHSPFVAPQRDWDLYDPDSIADPFPKGPAKGAPEKFVFHPSRYLRSFGGFPDSGPISEQDARTVRHAYLSCVSYIDRLTGEIIKTLEASGQRERTLIVFTSDHGYHLGEHGLWSKHTTYETATRVPLIFSGPGVAKGHSTQGLVELLDLFPTLAEIAELPLPKHLEGKSFAPTLANPREKARKAAFSEFSRGGARGLSIRSANYRYTEWRSLKNGELQARELYDHGFDPAETRNVAEETRYAPVITEMAALLKERLEGEPNSSRPGNKAAELRK